MNYKDYKRLKIGNNLSVGIFGKSLYALEVLTGIANAPEYHKITQQEFQTFEEWRDSEEKLNEFIERPVFCSAYKGYGDFNEDEVIRSIW